MATPRPATYYVPSGGTIYGGRFRPTAVLDLKGANSAQHAMSGSGSITLPAWVQDVELFQWKEIPDSSLALCPPSAVAGRSPGGKVAAWSGMTIDTRSNRVWMLANGGHTDYYGNEINMLDLSQDAPKWVEVMPPDAAGTFVIPNDASRYSNGRPPSCHTYYTTQMIEVRNRAVRFGTTAVASSGNSRNTVDGWDVAAQAGVDAWDPVDTFPRIPTATLPGHAIAKHPSTEDVYLFIANAYAYKWTQETGLWSKENTGSGLPVYTGHAAAAYDPVRERILLFRGNSDIKHTFTPATKAFTEVVFSGPALTDLYLMRSNGIGMVYDPDMDAYLLRGGLAGGGTVYKIDAESFEVTTLPATGGELIPGTAVISGSPENVWNRFQRAPKLGGLIYVPTYTGNAWFLRTK